MTAYSRSVSLEDLPFDLLEENIAGLSTEVAQKVGLIEPVNDMVTNSATEAIPDVTAARIHRVTLSNSPTLTFPTAVAGKSFTLYLIQDAAGGRIVTWPTTVRWATGSAPILATKPGHMDVINFLSLDGTYWLATIRGQDLASTRYTDIPAITDLTATANFFIDSVNGNDSNNGTSTATPWKTLSKITASGVTAGQKIALKCGSTFREALPTPASGTNGNPITYGAYGSGDRPKVKASTDYSSATWSVYSGSIYVATAASMPSSLVLYYDEYVISKKVASIAAITGPGMHYPDTGNNLLYVWTPWSGTPTGHTIELSGSVVLINNSSRNYVEFTDIAFMHGGQTNTIIVNSSTMTDVNFRRCQIGPMAGHGIVTGSSNSIIEDCYVVSCWDGIEYPSTTTFGAGIRTTTSTCIGVTIRRNRVTNCFYGIQGGNSSSQLVIHHNYVWLNRVNGIDINGSTVSGGVKNKVYNNTVWHRPSAAAGHGIDIQAGDGYDSKNNIVFSDFEGTPTNVEMFTIAAGTNANLAEDYNMGWQAPGNVAPYGKVNTTLYQTAALYFAAATSTYGVSNAHSFTGDPSFTDMASGDFTITADSAAINKGVVISGITDGYSSTAPDIGAAEYVAPPPPPDLKKLWTMGGETGDITEIYYPQTADVLGAGGQNASQGTAVASTDYARTGTYSIKCSVTSTLSQQNGVRLHRWAETYARRETRISGYVYFPQVYTRSNFFFNLMQIKSYTSANVSNPTFYYDVYNPSVGVMRGRMAWWPSASLTGTNALSGPYSTDDQSAKYYNQDGTGPSQSSTPVNIPVGQWMKLEFWLYQSHDFDGRLRVYQDDVLLWDFVNVRTGYDFGSTAFNSWRMKQNMSYNCYNDGTTPTPTVVYWDDMRIGTP